MARASIPRRVKRAWRHPQPPAMRHWKLVRRYFLRLAAAVRALEDVRHEYDLDYARSKPNRFVTIR